MALHLVKVLALAPPPDGKQLPPWHPDNFDQCLVNEDISQISGERSDGGGSNTLL